MAMKGIQWRFIPHGSPHMGGCCERLVRSVKTALGKTLNSAQKPEILTTMMAEAESIVNSKLLTHMSLDHHDNEAITPNHFLIGTSSSYQITGNFDESNLCLKKRWRIAWHLAAPSGSVG
ncbi:unnamed protein product [Allacma fusca]|uniref:Uncharacterized protein n=1 Tax=Allacma fusca TaxID=39272 RepID=A0A8J2K7K7_9HEXA|nr:unnamed protein product [Allacma fusca]